MRVAIDPETGAIVHAPVSAEKALDPELEVVFDRGTFRWEIWRFPKDGKPPMHQITVQTKDRTYRELGADIILQLQKSDPWRFNSKADLVAYFGRRGLDLVVVTEHVTFFELAVIHGSSMHVRCARRRQEGSPWTHRRREDQRPYASTPRPRSRSPTSPT
mgnify:CR=1 FL=1